ncbi:heterokaryon incompatibility protein-domain-containing protein [Lasiosphaeria hispida]|uniref:Heterokaryon incompatibility protein-domain-containing protein n=1 Tax=Lasiosphaeria hispida TaxID=260671 RepID=A0AAJ0HNW2_9PEZI|nr:heterokaryon incompatibility protein-domain-containing protein [Lasiosphaeria hispida]
MRLLHVQTFKLGEFYEDQTPPYAILSHTWGDNAEELTLQDILSGEPFKDGIGAKKLRGSCAQAEAEGLDYVWIDTCCIDKTNLAELSEAINSMFRWYQQAAVCYAYLWDVPASQNMRQVGLEFRGSRWFQRGWTLQELLAPRRMVFYSRDWTGLGTKVQLSTAIEEATGIPHTFLRGISDFRSASVAQRMSWASKRETKRKEDMAYSLLGIFGITMPMIYGEGGEQAFIRLQEQIMRTTRDQSILAWGLVPIPSANDLPSKPSQSLGFLAASPSEFAGSGDIVTYDQGSSYLDLLEIHGGDLRASISILNSSEDKSFDLFALLNCAPLREPAYVVGIPLKSVTRSKDSESSDHYLRPRGSFARLRSTFKLAGTRSTIHIHNDRANDGASHHVQGTEQRYGWVYNDYDLANLGLNIVEVFPTSAWDEERALITPLPAVSTTIESPGTESTSGKGIFASLKKNSATPPFSLQPTRVRLRHKSEAAKDFSLTLWFELWPWNGAIKETTYHIETIDRATKQGADISFDRNAKQTIVDNGELNLFFTFPRIAGEPFCTLRPHRYAVDEDGKSRIERYAEMQRAFNNLKV